MYVIYYSSLVDGTGRTSAPGDGITSPTRRLVALAKTKSAALAEALRMTEANGTALPGDGKNIPELDVALFEWRDFLSRQARENLTTSQSEKNAKARLLAGVPRVDK